MVTGQGNYVAETGELISKYVGDHMKYHLDEHDSFRELYVVRDQFKNKYLSLDR
jgi:hypothetical protein